MSEILLLPPSDFVAETWRENLTCAYEDEGRQCDFHEVKFNGNRVCEEDLLAEARKAKVAIADWDRHDILHSYAKEHTFLREIPVIVACYKGLSRYFRPDLNIVGLFDPLDPENFGSIGDIFSRMRQIIRVAATPVPEGQQYLSGDAFRTRLIVEGAGYIVYCPPMSRPIPMLKTKAETPRP